MNPRENHSSSPPGVTHNSNRRERNAYADSMETSALITMAIAGIGCLTGLIGMGFSFKADRRATRADQRAETADERAARAEEKSDRAEAAVEAAQVRLLWSALIDAGQQMIGASVIAKDMHPLLVGLRSSMTELIDAPATDGYGGLAKWLHSEHRMVNGLFALAQSKLMTGQKTVDQIAEAHDPVNAWLADFVNNLRVARKDWPKGVEDSVFLSLAESNSQQYEKFKQENPGLIPPDPRATA